MIEREVEQDDNGLRLDRWFKRHYPFVSHGHLEKLLRKGAVRLQGKKARSSDRLETGMMLRLPEGLEAPVAGAPRQKSAAVLSPGQERRMQALVILKTPQALAINKPAGLAVQGGSGQKESVDSLLDALRFGEKERPRLVHRLDRDTSGVLVLGRSATAAATLAGAFAGKETRKVYWALVTGVPKTPQGTIDLPLVKTERGKHSGSAVASDYEKVGVDAEEGKVAITHYRVVDTLGKELAWVELMPVTGRTHQLRVHMAAIGHPIVGDGKYGGSAAFISGLDLPKQLHLHARRLIIPRIFGGRLDVSAELPAHMKQSWKLLGLSPKDNGLSLAEQV